MGSIIAVSIAVAGWLVNHLLSLRAQKTMFLNQIRNNARIEIIKSLREYNDWLDKLSQIHASLHLIGVFKDTEGNEQDQLTNFRQQFRDHICLSDNELHCIRLLEEYEPLYPGTSSARIYMREMHICLYIHFREKSNELVETVANLSKSKQILRSFNGQLIGAQQWIVRDFIVCFQNISLGEITKHRIPERQVPVVKYPRLVTTKKNEIIVVPGSVRLPA